MGAKVFKYIRTRAYLVWLIGGCVLIVLSRMLGSVAPDIEKIFNDFQRGVWHLYGADNLLHIAAAIIGFSSIFLCLWLAITYRSRHKWDGILRR